MNPTGNFPRAHHGRVPAVVAVGWIAAVLVLAGCTSGPAPLPTTATAWAAEPDGTPAVIWPHGEPDDGRWADNPWVQATRTFVRAYAGAFYLDDFTLCQRRPKIDPLASGEN
ncbi:hypothetical protein [Cellulomonas hominis]